MRQGRATSGRGDGPGAPAVRVSTATPVRCPFRTHRLPTDWYLPAAEPIGLLYAQHGFAESRSDWREFAAAAAESGFVVVVPTLPTVDLTGCTVQNMGNNTRFLYAVADLFRAPDPTRGALADGFAAATRQAGRPDPGLPARLVVIGHSAGGEAALAIADRVSAPAGSAASTPGSGSAAGVPADLRGVVLADPVCSIAGDTTAGALRSLATRRPLGSADPLPVRVLAAPPGRCNADQSGTRAVLAALPDRDFPGVLVAGGSHADIYGGAANRIERWVCGTPAPVNVAATRALALGWLRDAVIGSFTAGAYPGSAGFTELVDSGVVALLR